MYTDQLKQMLRRNDLKVTPIRLMVLDILIQSEVALSHHDITEKLNNADIDKVTLYRTLNIFTEKNLIHKVPTDDRNWLYAILLDKDERPIAETLHAHFICDKCEAVYCYPIARNVLETNTTEKEGFVITTKEIRLHGLCPSCH